MRVGGLGARGEWVATLGAKAATDSWRTPPELFHELDAEFDFALDAAATRENALCPAHYTRMDDGLRQPWVTWTWANVPYGSPAEWIAKAARECDERGVGSALLLREDSSTRAWHAHVEGKREVQRLPGRLRFLTPDGRRLGPAPFASVLVVFRPHENARS